MVRNQTNQGFFKIDILQDSSNPFINLGVHPPNAVEDLWGFLIIVVAAFRINAPVQDVLHMIDRPDPAEGHVPIYLAQSISSRLLPPIVVLRQLVQVEIQTHPAVHISPRVINLHVGTCCLNEFIGEPVGDRDRLRRVDGTLVQFEIIGGRSHHMEVKAPFCLLAARINKGFSDPVASFPFCNFSDFLRSVLRRRDNHSIIPGALGIENKYVVMRAFCIGRRNVYFNFQRLSSMIRHIRPPRSGF